MAAGRDPIADAMTLLLGEEAAGIVDPAVPAGSTIRSLRAVQVLFRPGSRVAVTYRAVLEWGDGMRVDEMVVAMVDRSGLPAGAATAYAGDERVAVWRAPQDPELPGLGLALDPTFGHRLLTDSGVRARTADVTLYAYRPGRRAVVEVRPVEPETPRLVFSPGSGTLRPAQSGGAPALYLKVLEPERAAEVAEVHHRLARLLPVAPCSFAGGPGILRLGAMRGVTLGACLRRGTSPPPDVADVLELLARLEAARLGGPEDIGSDVRLRRHVKLLLALLPDEADRLERLRSALHGARDQPTVTIHGDFHEGNILVEDRRVAGLLDVDDAGPGELVDDLGLLIGRVWSLGHGRAEEAALRYSDELLRRADALVDPGELRRRVGVALIGRATGPFRNQLEDWPGATRRRLEQAERWVASAAPMLP